MDQPSTASKEILRPDTREYQQEADREEYGEKKEWEDADEEESEIA